MSERIVLKVMAGAIAMALFAGACGDDDTDAASGGASADPAESEYCVMALELDSQEEFPDEAQLEALEAAAPAEIEDDVAKMVGIVAAAIETGEMEAVFEDPAFAAAFGPVEEYGQDVCGIDAEGDGGDGVDEAAVNPEFADYCAIAAVIDSQDNFPSSEQMEELRSLAPAEIADEVALVVDAFVAAGDDPFAAFETPGVEDAFTPIEAFETRECGIGGDDGNEDEESDQDPSVTELDPAAARIDVTATDHAFEFGSTPAAGPTSFVMKNEGQERHVMLLFRLSEGFTVDEVLESDGDDGFEEEFESDTAAAGEESVLTVDLVAGEYGMICYIPDADGKPHFMLGMQKSFTIA